MARRFGSIGESSSSIVQAMDDDNIVYVAVGKEVEETKLTLKWVLDNFDGRVCIIHVHQSSKRNPMYRFAEQQLRVTQEYEMQKMDKILNDYLQICSQAGVRAEKLHIEMDDVGEGIVELVYRHSIKKLVMGAAANKHYTERMILKSKKAIYVCQHVPSSCQIWFICNGLRIVTREGDVEVTSPNSVVETGPSNPNSPFLDSGHLGCSSSEVVGDSTMTSSERTEEVTVDQLINRLEEAVQEAEKSKREAYEESVKRVKAEKTEIEALRRLTASKEGIDKMMDKIKREIKEKMDKIKARALQNSYTEELRYRREIEEELAKLKETLKEMKKQWDEERLTAMDQKQLLESQFASYGHAMKELNDKISSSMEMAEIFKKERDDLQIKHDDAVKLTVDLLSKTEEASSSHMNQCFTEFDVSEIQEATNCFHPSLKIAEGGYGSIYQGSLRKTEVAIKVVHPTSLQGPSQFEQEVNVLSKLRHPNLVTLIGVCPEIWALIYEYLPNGSLEDHLSCRNTTPPLSWQTRIRIATDLCSVLIFLHTINPCVVHGNLKPRNILLDANFACKLSDFGICRALSLRENSSNRTDTSPYLDPEFLTTGELSPKSDIYSFGIILVQLLTGISPLHMVNYMQNSMDQDNLYTSLDLDPSAGDWPTVQARRLAYLAVNCCGNRSRQPDLSDVWDVLKRMRDSCEAPSSIQPASEDDSEAPSYFLCPISQDVMQDPHFAADGFTYELEEIRRWLNSGNDNSPMTNVRLPHRNLIPNFALRSAIQEWQQQHSNVHS